MTEEKFTYDYYIVGQRPVKVKKDEEGLERGIYALNWKTGEFDLNHSYWEKLEKDNIDTNEVDEEAFNKQVQKMMKKNNASKLKKPGM
ncbi:MAG: hypothetical protein OIF36_05390 [Alphaproteobacteria bacterium]|nr:hypothetical protein [Alphaproteobacteria bacterium]